MRVIGLAAFGRSGAQRGGGSACERRTAGKAGGRLDRRASDGWSGNFQANLSVNGSFKPIYKGDTIAQRQFYQN